MEPNHGNGNRIVNKFKKIWSSGSDEYTTVKFLVSFPIGLILGVSYYYAGVHRLQLRPEVDRIVGTGVVTSVAVGYAVSTQVRATSLLVLPSMFTKEGRLWLTTYSYTLILEGPVENLIGNTQEILRGVTCSLSFVAQTKEERLKALQAPLQLFSSKMNDDVNNLDRKVKGVNIQTSPNSFQGADEQLTLEEAMYVSDAAAADSTSQDDNSDRLIERRRKSAEVNKEMNERCKAMYEEPKQNCLTKLESGQEGCEDGVEGPTRTFYPNICNTIRVDEEECNQYRPSDKEIEKMCDAEKDVGLEEAFEEHETLIAETDKSSSEKIKFSAKEASYERNVNQTSRQDVAKGAQERFETNRRKVEFITSAIRKILAFSFLLIVRRAWKYNLKYRTDILYDNAYITEYFRKIDQRRLEQNKKVLLPLRKAEKKEIVMLNSLKLIAAEKKRLLKNLIAWLTRLTFSSLIIFMDYVLHEVLAIVRKHSRLDIHQDTYNVLEVYVNGTGGVADSVRDMVSGLNYSYVSNQTISNIECLPNPIKLPSHLIRNIYLIFAAQLVLSFLEAYGLRMRRLIASIFYRKREKKRVLYLYNDMQKRRKVNLHHSRQQLRKRALEHLLEQEGEFQLLPCLKKKEVKKRCIVCEAKLVPETTERCQKDRCHLFYCKDCWTDVKGYCLGCTKPATLDRVLSKLVLAENEVN